MRRSRPPTDGAVAVKFVTKKNVKTPANPYTTGTFSVAVGQYLPVTDGLISL
jgi:hypothetical protein